MKLRADQKIIYDADTGKARIVPRENPKLNTSAKIQQRKSKRTRPLPKGHLASCLNSS